MTITDIYSQYKIMPSLQLHMLRVAAVASFICDYIIVGNDHGRSLHKEKVVTATLLHDMGNIIKFNLGYVPEFLEPEGLEYWQKVKADFVTKYGDDEHAATYQIAKELGVDAETLNIIRAIGFSKSLEAVESTDFSNKIACYSDQRVALNGITSLQERMDSGRERFRSNKNVDSSKEKKFLVDFNKYSTGMRELETQIFENCDIKPEGITDEVIRGIIEELKDFKIVTKN